MLFRFSKRVKQSGVLTEARKRRFHGRVKNRRKVRIAAQYREAKKAEVIRLRRLGLA
jgi:ribosomal protein S21